MIGTGFWIKIWTEWFSVSQPLAEQYAPTVGWCSSSVLLTGLLLWAILAVLKVWFEDDLPKHTRKNYFFSGLFLVLLGVLLMVVPVLLFR